MRNYEILSAKNESSTVSWFLYGDWWRLRCC